VQILESSAEGGIEFIGRFWAVQAFLRVHPCPGGACIEDEIERLAVAADVRSGKHLNIVVVSESVVNQSVIVFFAAGCDVHAFKVMAYSFDGGSALFEHLDMVVLLKVFEE